MKNNKIVILVFIIMDLIVLLFGSYVSYAEYRTNTDINMYFTMENETNVLVDDNKYTNDIANEVINLDYLKGDIINFINYNSDSTVSWYYYGDEITNSDVIKKGRFFNENELNSTSNKVLVSEKVYFENNKNSTLKIKNDEYEIIGVLDREFSQVNGVDYLFPAYGYINDDVKFTYQIINIKSEEAVNKTQITNLIHEFDSNISVSTGIENLKNSIDFSLTIGKLQILIKNTILLLIFIILLAMYFYAKEKIYKYRVYQLFGISEKNLFYKVIKDFFGILLFPLIIVISIYHILLLLNGVVFYSEIFFVYFDKFLFLKFFLCNIVLGLIFIILVYIYIYIHSKYTKRFEVD